MIDSTSISPYSALSTYLLLFIFMVMVIGMAGAFAYARINNISDVERDDIVEKSLYFLIVCNVASLMTLALSVCS